MPISHFEKALQLLGIAKGSPIAVAVSGGADSLALLSLAAERARNGKIRDNTTATYSSSSS